MALSSSYRHVSRNEMAIPTANLNFQVSSNSEKGERAQLRLTSSTSSALLSVPGLPLPCPSTCCAWALAITTFTAASLKGTSLLKILCAISTLSLDSYQHLLFMLTKTHAYRIAAGNKKIIFLKSEPRRIVGGPRRVAGLSGGKSQGPR
jgi:hypothetical protein